MRRIAAALILGVAVAAGLSAQDLDLTLHHANLEDLSPEARAAYEHAYEAFDRADHVGAIRALADAAELAPDKVELQILFLDVTQEHLRLRNFSHDEALVTAQRAVAAYERILNRPDLPGWAHRLIERERENVVYILDNVEALYAEKMEAGSSYLQEMAALKNQLATLREDQEAELRAERARGANMIDPWAPHPLFAEAAAARAGGSSGAGVSRVGSGVRSSTAGVESVN
jgi:hypothetical protein